MTETPRAIRYLQTTDAYNIWASVYDHDSNFLQKLDDGQFPFLLDTAIDLLRDASSPRKIVDMGCGTGRITKKLLKPEVDDGTATIVAVDASPAMLDVAKQEVPKISGGQGRSGKMIFDVLDLLSDEELPVSVLNADMVVSGLVLEHIPCDTFFQKGAQMLRPGGILVMSNMHSDMGAISQAGFVDPKTGEKLRPTSYPHTVGDVEKSARKFGLSPRGGIKEVAVGIEDVEKLGSRSKKWVGVKCWYGGVFMLIDESRN